MATPGAIAKRTEKRQIEILEAVKMLEAEVADLKTKIGEPDVIELKAEIDELRPPIAPPPAAATRRTKK